MSLSPGRHILVVTALDVAGNVSNATVEFTVGDEAVDIHKLIADLEMACGNPHTGSVD